MFISFLFVFVTFDIYAQTTYYVSQDGVDSPHCGETATPCASINQVLDNYPGQSYIVSVLLEINLLNKISFQKDAQVIFQGAGAGSTVINIPEIWTTESNVFITNTPSSGFEFHDSSLGLYRTLRGYFTFLGSEENVAGFYNIATETSPGVVVVGLIGGVVVMSNVSFTWDFSYVLLKNDQSEGGATSINITSCIFADVLNDFGGLVYLTGPGVTEFVLDNTSFFNVSATVNLITADVHDLGSLVTVTNNVFNITHAFKPAVTIGFAQYDYEVLVQNTTFINCSASDYFSGGLAINRSESKVVGSPVTLADLRFEACQGLYAGALYIGYNSFVLSRSSFVGNTVEERIGANDIFFATPSASSHLEYSISLSDSSSALPKAVIWTDDTESTTDISGNLPNPGGPPPDGVVGAGL